MHVREKDKFVNLTKSDSTPRERPVCVLGCVPEDDKIGLLNRHRYISIIVARIRSNLGLSKM